MPIRHSLRRLADSARQIAAKLPSPPVQRTGLKRLAHALKNPGHQLTIVGLLLTWYLYQLNANANVKADRGRELEQLIATRGELQEILGDSSTERAQIMLLNSFAGFVGYRDQLDQSYLMFSHRTISDLQIQRAISLMNVLNEGSKSITNHDRGTIKNVVDARLILLGKNVVDAEEALAASKTLASKLVVVDKSEIAKAKQILSAYGELAKATTTVSHQSVLEAKRIVAEEEAMIAARVMNLFTISMLLAQNGNFIGSKQYAIQCLDEIRIVQEKRIPTGISLLTKTDAQAEIYEAIEIQALTLLAVLKAVVDWDQGFPSEDFNKVYYRIKEGSCETIQKELLAASIRSLEALIAMSLLESAERMNKSELKKECESAARNAIDKLEDRCKKYLSHLPTSDFSNFVDVSAKFVFLASAHLRTKRAKLLLEKGAPIGTKINSAKKDISIARERMKRIEPPEELELDLDMVETQLLHLERNGKFHHSRHNLLLGRLVNSFQTQVLPTEKRHQLEQLVVSATIARATYLLNSTPGQPDKGVKLELKKRQLSTLRNDLNNFDPNKHPCVVAILWDIDEFLD